MVEAGVKKMRLQAVRVCGVGGGGWNTKRAGSSPIYIIICKDVWRIVNNK